jgi:hypothetical protein
MLSFAYDVADWARYVFGALGVAALALLAWRLARGPRDRVIGPVIALIVMAGLTVGSVAFLDTRVEQITLGRVRQVGLEARHAGLRTEAVVYDVPATFTAYYKLGPFSGISKFLYHKTVTVQPQVAVYGLIDFSAISGRVATVNRQAKTIRLSLPEPQIGPNTTYISSVGTVSEQTGLLNAVQQSLAGPVEAILHHPALSFNARPALRRAEAKALARARRSAALDSCGKQEIARQLTDAFRLTPAYRGYTVHITWPRPPASGVNCAGLQKALAQAGG